MIDLLRQRLSDYLVKCEPDAEIHDFQFLAKGWECEVYAFTLRSSSRPAQSLILRVFPGNDADKKLLREANGVQFLNQAGFPVPALYFSESDPSILGNPFCIVERIHGKPLWRTLYEVPTEQSEALLQQFSELLARLHQLEWRSFPDVAESVKMHPDTVLDELFGIFRWFCERYDLPGFVPLADWLERHQAEIRFQPAVVHLDFHANNVLLCDDGRMVVIDWTQASVLDYRADLSWVLMLMGEHGQAEWRNQILDAYERAAGHSVSHLEYFDVLTYAKRFLFAVVSLKFSPQEFGLRADAIEGISGELPVLEKLYRRLCVLTGLSVPEVESLLAHFAKSD